MSLSPEHQEAVLALKKSVDELLGARTEDLVREGPLGQLNFREVATDFESIFKIFRDVAQCDVEALPLQMITELHSHVQQTQALLSTVKAFDLNHQNPNQTRSQIISGVRSQWNVLFRSVGPLISYARMGDSDSARLAKDFQDLVSKQTATLAEASREKDALLEDMRKTLATIKDNAAEAGVTRHSGYFKGEADGHSTSAMRWLRATFAFGLAMLAYALVVFRYDTAPASSATLYSTIHLLVPRITFLLVIGFGLVWSARNYSSARHNEVVNRHRQNALNSFETFVKSAQDVETKNAVLLQATHSIFAPQDTAFSRNDPPAAPGSQIVEIIRGVSGSKSS